MKNVLKSTKLWITGSRSTKLWIDFLLQNITLVSIQIAVTHKVTIFRFHFRCLKLKIHPKRFKSTPILPFFQMFRSVTSEQMKIIWISWARWNRCFIYF